MGKAWVGIRAQLGDALGQFTSMFLIHFLLILLIEVLLTSEERQDGDKQPRLLQQQLIKLPRLKPNVLKKLTTLKLDKLI